MRAAALIPHYNHAGTIAQVAQGMRALGLPVLIVDDGSTSADARRVLDELAAEPGIQVRFCAENGGKGQAMKAGIRWALAEGYSHALQVDADGQHQLSDGEALLDAARRQPDALVCGRPVYGSDAPFVRRYGREFTNFWASVNAGVRVQDAMCGFRVYPVVSTLHVMDHERVGNRMDFDIEILVRLVWRGVPLVWVPTPVRYESGGVSHFAPLRDNLRISGMHARLFLGMLRRRLGLGRRL